MKIRKIINEMRPTSQTMKYRTIAKLANGEIKKFETVLDGSKLDEVLETNRCATPQALITKWNQTAESMKKMSHGIEWHYEMM